MKPGQDMGLREVKIFDTTLRDGIQGLGVALEDRLAVFAMLDKAGLDVIEVALVGARSRNLAQVRAAAATIQNARVCCIASPEPEAITRAGRALRQARRSRIHTFNGVASGRKNGRVRDRLGQIKAAVASARAVCDDVEWAALDATRSTPDFLCRAVETAIRAGATTVNIADTMGVVLPEEFANIIRDLIARVPNIDKATISVHCHDDLGLATANSLAAIQAGARQVECAINGLGPKGGNANLQEVVTALARRGDALGGRCGVDGAKLAPLGALVRDLVSARSRH
ncbi:MAG: hypothetical protein QF926_07015 [Alphaproteobacteria bacterium]|nr:hypothetical protein [Alphaproteobacteria bacterium]